MIIANPQGDTNVVGTTPTTFSLSTMFSFSGPPAMPYVVLNVIDRNEYTASSTGQTGYLTTDAGQTMALTQDQNGDGREFGATFAYDAASGRYLNATYGDLSLMTFTTSSSPDDLTAISLFNASSTYNGFQSNALYECAFTSSANYLGTATFVTDPTGGHLTPAQATPESIAQTAMRYVGATWNTEGCWILAETIATLSGANLPLYTIGSPLAGTAAGNEWIVAFNGRQSSQDWLSTVRTGDVVTFVNPDGRTAHVSTVVSGSGANALVVDNQENGNYVYDGTGHDISILAPHALSQEVAGINQSSVTVFRLDTPTVSSAMASLVVTGGSWLTLADEFSAADPAQNAITEYQIATTDAADVVGNADGQFAATAPITLRTLSDAYLQHDAAGGSDTITMRAFNGTYWGDWTSVALSGNAGAPQAMPAIAPPPVVVPPVIVPPPIVVPPPVLVPPPVDVPPVVPPVVVPPVDTPTVEIPPAATPPTVTTLPDTVQPPIATPTPQADPTPTPSVSANTIYRFFDSVHGTELLTSSLGEVKMIQAARPDLAFEGPALGSVAADPGNPNVAQVFRFFNTQDGTHFFTASAGEAASIAKTRPDMAQEQSNMFEHVTQQTGDVAVYRFFNSGNGSHFFTSSAGEAASLAQTRPDMVNEGIAFYSPHLA